MLKTALFGEVIKARPLSTQKCSRQHMLDDITDFYRIALMIFDAHIINLHISVARSVALGQGYFSHCDYLVVH